MNWLSRSRHNKLIIFYKDVNKKKTSPNIVRARNQLKNKMMEYVNDYIGSLSREKIKDQILVSYNPDIFDFSESDLVK